MAAFIRTCAVLLGTLIWAQGLLAQPRSTWQTLVDASVQLWTRSFGAMEALCSGAMVEAPDGKVYLLTAGHCAALPGTLWSATTDGSQFMEATVVASGWKHREAAPVMGFVEHLRRSLPAPSQASWEAFDTSKGDWGLMKTKLQTKAKLKVARRKVSMGDILLAVGFPAGGDRFATQGIVANPVYRALGTPWDKYIASDITALPGSSGTAVVNQDGEVVGILVAGITGTRLQLLTPVEMVIWPQ